MSIGRYGGGGVGDFLNSRIAIELQATTDVVPILIEQIGHLTQALSAVQNQNAAGLATTAQVREATKSLADVERYLAQVLKNESANARKVAGQAALDEVALEKAAQEALAYLRKGLTDQDKQNAKEAADYRTYIAQALANSQKATIAQEKQDIKELADYQSYIQQSIANSQKNRAAEEAATIKSQAAATKELTTADDEVKRATEGAATAQQSLNTALEQRRQRALAAVDPQRALTEAQARENDALDKKIAAATAVSEAMRKYDAYNKMAVETLQRLGPEHQSTKTAIAAAGQAANDAATATNNYATACNTVKDASASVVNAQNAIENATKRGQGTNDAATQGMLHLTRTIYFASQAADDLQYSFCLKRGSLIRMSDGSFLPIEDIRPGDTVVSLLASGRLGSQIIRASVFSGIKTIRRLSTDTGQNVECSGNHPILTPNGWVEAEKFRVGDLVATPEAESIRWVPIASIEHLGDHPTHDLQLVGEPNFIAGGIVVHNSAIVNNLPLIGMEATRAAGAFGVFKGSAAELNALGMQVGAAVAFAGVAINSVLIPAFKSIVDRSPGLRAFFHEMNVQLNPMYVHEHANALGRLTERIKELESKKLKLAVDITELDTAKQKLKELEDGKRAFDALMRGHTPEEEKAGEYIKKDLAGGEGKAALQEIRKNLYAEAEASNKELQELYSEAKENLRRHGATEEEIARSWESEDVKEKARVIKVRLKQTTEAEAGDLLNQAQMGSRAHQERLIDLIGKRNRALAETLERDVANAMADMDRQADMEQKGRANAAERRHEVTKKSIKAEEQLTKDAEKAVDDAVKEQAKMFAEAEGGTRVLGPGFTVESIKKDLDNAKRDSLKQYAEGIRVQAIGIAKGAVEKRALSMGPGTTPEAAVADIKRTYTEKEQRERETAEARAEKPGRELAQKYQQPVSEEMLRLTYESLAAGKPEDFIRQRMSAELQRRMMQAGEEAGVAQQGAGILAGDLLQKARAGVAGIGDRPARQAAAYLAQEAQIKARRTFEAEGARHIQDVGIGIGALPTAEQRQFGQVRGSIARAGQNFATQNLAQQFAGATNATDAQALTMAKRSMQMMQRGVSFNEATTVAYQEMMRQLYQLEFRQMRTERQMLQTRRARNGNNLNSR